MDELTGYNFKIIYRQGKQNLKADALTRRSGDLPSEGDPVLTQHYQSLLKPHQVMRIQATEVTDPKETKESTRIQEIRQAQTMDPTLQEIRKQLQAGIKRSKLIDISKVGIHNDILVFNTKVIIPDNHELQVTIAQENHNHELAGHPGRDKMFELISREYW